MIKINLLPFKRKRASTLTKDVRDLALLLILLCIGFGYYYFMMLRPEINEQQLRIESTKKEIASLQPIAQEYKTIQEAKNEIQRRIQTLNQLKSGRALVARSLYDISSIIKEGVWIKSFKKTDMKFEIEGRSFVNENISDFIEKPFTVKLLLERIKKALAGEKRDF